MKKVLCFGDSNTYGYNPKSGNRYPKDMRWTGVLQLSRPDLKIIEAGCNNRTGFVDNPAGTNFTGYKVLPSLISCSPDILIIAIGINDLQSQYNVTLDNFRCGIEQMLIQVRQILPTSAIIILAPTVITPDILRSNFASLFDQKSVEKSSFLPQIYKEIAHLHACTFLDLNTIIQPSAIDGLHYSEYSHTIIAQAVSELL